MAIAATDRTCVLDVQGDGDLNGHRTLKVDRNGAALEHVTSLPWQTVVVIEDGSVDLGGGVSLARVGTGEVDVVNHSGKKLTDVVVHVPGHPLVYFGELKNGDRKNTAAGQTMTSSGTRRTVGAASGVLAVHPLDTASLGFSLDEQTAKRLRDEWRPFEGAAGSDVDWWPDEQPVLLAEIAGGEGRGKDSGLGIEQDRELLRVVGLGESP